MIKVVSNLEELKAQLAEGEAIIAEGEALMAEIRKEIARLEGMTELERLKVATARLDSELGIGSR